MANKLRNFLESLPDNALLSRELNFSAFTDNNLETKSDCVWRAKNTDNKINNHTDLTYGSFTAQHLQVTYKTEYKETVKIELLMNPTISWFYFGDPEYIQKKVRKLAKMAEDSFFMLGRQCGKSRELDITYNELQKTTE